MAVTQVGTPTASTVITATGASGATWSGTQTRSAGNIMVMVITATATTSVSAITAPTGYSTAYNVTNTFTTTACFYKVAVGTDASPSVTITMSGTARATTSLFLLTGADSSFAIMTSGTTFTTNATVASTAPPSSAPLEFSGGYAIASYAKEQPTAATATYTAPTGFTNFFTDATTSTRNHNAVYVEASPTSGAILTPTLGTTSTATSYTVGGVVVFAPTGSTPFTLYNQITETLTGPGGTGGGALGVHFNVSQTSYLPAIWAYSPSGQTLTALPEQIALFNYTTQALITSQAATWSGAFGTGWIKSSFSSPITLSSGTEYMAAIYSSNATAIWFVYNQTSWTQPIRSGMTTAPISDGAQGWYNTTNTSVAFPGTQLANWNWFVDPQISTTSGFTARIMTSYI